MLFHLSWSCGRKFQRKICSCLSKTGHLEIYPSLVYFGLKFKKIAILVITTGYKCILWALQWYIRCKQRTLADKDINNPVPYLPFFFTSMVSHFCFLSPCNRQFLTSASFRHEESNQ